ncbi:MAG: hypothetical protein AMXMBFR56_37140 [Polyangiaceae bacterium]
MRDALVPAAAVALALLGCRPAKLEQAESRLASGEQRQRQVDEIYTLTELDHREMKRLAGEMDAMFARARADWLHARDAYTQAAQAYGEASTVYAGASADYEQAAREFRRITTTLIMAAASDLFLRGVCGPNVSTGQYRRQLEAEGVDLRGMHIDHIVARARGGPNRPWNYNPLEASINMSLGAGGMGWKLMNFPLQTLDALAKNATYQLLCK